VQVGSLQVSYVVGLPDQRVFVYGSSCAASAGGGALVFLAVGSSTSVAAVGCQEGMNQNPGAVPTVTTLLEAGAVGLVTRYLIYRAGAAGQTAYAVGVNSASGGEQNMAVLRAHILG
jgi:hypothetical protein